MRGRRVTSGFTLIEITIVAAILGTLAMIALPKFADMVEKAKEASNKGKMGCVRSAVSLYYADNEGDWYPTNGQVLTFGGRYLDALPTFYVPRRKVGLHMGVNFFGFNSNGRLGVTPMETLDLFMTMAIGGERTSPLHQYFFNAYNPGIFCLYWDNCTHTDTRGEPYSTY